MSTSQIKALEDFVNLQNRNAISHAIRAAMQLGIFSALREGQKTVKQLSDSLDLNEQALARLMTVLCQTELIEQYEDDFALSTIARLIPDPYFDFGDQHWQHLASHIRTGSNLPDDKTFPQTNLDYVVNKASEEWMQTPAAMDAAEVLDVGKSRRGLRILEIGCGSAVFGISITHRDADSVLNLVDDAAGIARSKATVKSVEIERQVEWIEADDYLKIKQIPELDKQLFDLIIVSGIVHRHSEEVCRQLIFDLADLTKPERELAIIDIFPGQPQGDLQRSVFELELSLRTSNGQLHSPNFLKSTMQDAGFSNVQYAHLPSPPFIWGLILGGKGL